MQALMNGIESSPYLQKNNFKLYFDYNSARNTQVVL